MLTPEQMDKAKAALQREKTKELVRRIMLHRYTQDIEKAERWCLPFKMVHDRQYLPDEEPPGDYYGRPAPVIYDKTKYCMVTNPEAGPPITKEKAIFYFTRHLVAVNLDEYGRGDWTGKTVTQEEADLLKAMFQGRQRDFVRNPHKYDQERHPVRTDTLFDDATSP